MMVRFAPDTKASDVIAFLGRNDAAIVGTASGGLFKVQFGRSRPSAADADAIAKRVQSDRIVAFSAASD
jgi:hypothetical protein